MQALRNAPGAQRPLVAFVINVLTPYRLHVHKRIAREASGIRLATLLTHDQPDQPWARPDDAAINPVRFGEGQPVSDLARPRFLLRDWSKGGRITRWLCDHDAAAVIVAGYNDVTRLKVISFCHTRRIPCFLTADSNSRGDRARGLRRVIKGAVVRAVVNRCTGVMPCGTLGREYFIRYGADSARVFLHPYEPDYDLFLAVTDEEIDEACGSLKVERRRLRAVVSARLVPDKRVDVAIDAFAAFAVDRPDWDLVVIGDGPLGAALRARVPADLHGRVIWAGFQADPARVAAIYRACQVLICPSEWEPWGVVINEAVASGMAVVASSVVGAAADLVQDGLNGLIVPCGDARALAHALRKVSEPERLSSMQAASASVLASWRRRADPVDGLLSALRSCGVVPESEPHVAASSSALSH